MNLKENIEFVIPNYQIYLLPNNNLLEHMITVGCLRLSVPIIQYGKRANILFRQEESGIYETW